MSAGAALAKSPDPACCSAASCPAAQARAHRGLGEVSIQFEAYEDALAPLRRALDLYRRLGDLRPSQASQTRARLRDLAKTS